MIQCRNLSYSYAPGQGISRISIEIPDSSIYLLTGPNGSGKSTLLKILAGGLRQSRGEITFKRDDNLLPDKRLPHKFNVSLSPQQPETQFSLRTVRHELRFTSAVTGLPYDEDMESEIVSLLGLAGKLDISPYDLIQSDRKLLSLAIAGLVPSGMVALDEPTAGLDVSRKKRIPDLIKLLQTQRRSILLVSHDIVFFLPLATHLGILQKGISVESCPVPEFLSKVASETYPPDILRDFLLPRLGKMIVSTPVVSAAELAEQILVLISQRNKKLSG